MSLSRRRLLMGFGAPFFAPNLKAAAAAMTESHSVRKVEPVFIPTRSGIKLAARLWIPDSQAPSPVVLEYIPYRTFDRYRALDDRWGEKLASQGIAFARVDIRGSGNSEGLLLDEYLSSEQDDGVDVVEWLAQQPWCNGKVGMRGISWGGFSTLQIAALRPVPLKAIMPMCATDNRFANDAHYVGGLPGLTNLKWAAGFELVMSSPPDPAVVGLRWDDMWRERLEATPSIAARWLQHQSNDAYWRHGSVGLAPEAIECPVYLVDGWADSYAQSAERLLRSLNAPTQAIVGPWGHIYPDLAQPGPGLDWASEEIGWWRRWLMDGAGNPDPKLRFYVNYATPSETAMKDIPGRWASEKAWPSPDIVGRVFHLAPGELIPVGEMRRESKDKITSSKRETQEQLRYRRSGIVGLATPEWIPYAAAELPRDQRTDDARALVFDCPIVETTEVVGVPRLNVRLASDRPLAALAARLCEVDKDGRSWLVTYGIHNLCFRNGLDAAPTPLEPNQFFEVTVELNPVAHRYKAGSILRLAISDTLWPLVWPSPEPVTLTFNLDDCALRLPVRPVPSAEVPFTIAIRGAGFSRGNPSLEIRESPNGAVEVLGSWPDRPSVIAATNTEISGAGPDMELRYNPADPSSCHWRVSESSRYRRDDWDCEMRVEIVMTSTRTHFQVEETLTALKNKKPFFSRNRRDEIERRFS